VNDDIVGKIIVAVTFDKTHKVENVVELQVKLTTILIMWGLTLVKDQDQHKEKLVLEFFISSHIY
jgi:hypothetical protein